MPTENKNLNRLRRHSMVPISSCREANALYSSPLNIGRSLTTQNQDGVRKKGRSRKAADDNFVVEFEQDNVDDVTGEGLPNSGTELENLKIELLRNSREINLSYMRMKRLKERRDRFKHKSGITYDENEEHDHDSVMDTCDDVKGNTLIYAEHLLQY
ncbi:hypothetical protein ACF0H5_013936 [Mactra antiquata]